MGDRLQEYFPLLKLPRISTENTAPSLFNSPAHPVQVHTGAKNYMETTVRGNRWSNLRPEPEGRSRSGSECPPCGEIWAANQQEHRLALGGPHFHLTLDRGVEQLQTTWSVIQVSGLM